MCSPINPSACRTWVLHRFDLDCGGKRVDWVSVVEAASEQSTGRAWVENGRLRMRMNQYWSRDVGPDDDPVRAGAGVALTATTAPTAVCVAAPSSRCRPASHRPSGLQVRFAAMDLPPLPADPRAGVEGLRHERPRQVGAHRDTRATCRPEICRPRNR